MNLELARTNLRSHNPDVLTAALNLLGEAGALGDLQAVMANLKHENTAVQRCAVAAASNIIRANLLAHFDKVAPEVRQKLGVIMESLDPEVVAELGKDVYCEDEERRLRAVQILGLLRRNPKVREILADLVKERDEKIRATAIRLLGNVIGPNDQDIILSLLKDEDKRVRANTVEALESVGNKRMVPILLRFRKDPSNRIRGNVLKALYNLGHRDIDDDLLEMLRSKDNFMNASALWVIGMIKTSSREMEDVAGFCLISDNEMVVINARKALQAMETPRAKGYLRYLDDGQQIAAH